MCAGVRAEASGGAEYEKPSQTEEQHLQRPDEER